MPGRQADGVDAHPLVDEPVPAEEEVVAQGRRPDDHLVALEGQHGIVDFAVHEVRTPDEDPEAARDVHPEHGEIHPGPEFEAGGKRRPSHV